MLSLSRNIGEYIIIGNDLVKIKVLGIQGAQVRLGFEAAADIPIHRKEIFDRLKKEGKEFVDKHLTNELDREIDRVLNQP